MELTIHPSAEVLGKSAGSEAIRMIRHALDTKGSATIIIATGTSQFLVLDTLTKERSINWSKVTLFHLDEYIGLPLEHPASFRKYIQERFIQQIDPLETVYLIDGEQDPNQECMRLKNAIEPLAIDLALVGIGENGHLAFNDPPADFETTEPYIVVDLDEACRKQQFNEGWFASIEDVPKKAISMSIREIMRANHIICSVPDLRKAEAVQHCLEREIDPRYPASMLRLHPSCTLHLDTASAHFLKK